MRRLDLRCFIGSVETQKWKNATSQLNKNKNWEFLLAEKLRLPIFRISHERERRYRRRIPCERRKGRKMIWKKKER